MEELETKVCPYCGETNKAHRMNCNYCDMRLDEGNGGKKLELITTDNELEGNKYVKALEIQSSIIQSLAIIGSIGFVIWAVVEKSWSLVFAGIGVLFVGLIYSNMIYTFCGIAKDISDIKRTLER